jgi:hypothetical protein
MARSRQFLFGYGFIIKAFFTSSIKIEAFGFSSEFVFINNCTGILQP